MMNARQAVAPRTHHYNYQDTLAASLKIGWRIEDIIGGDKKLDFTKPFLPEAIAEAVLAHEPLSVALTILHIEWMTQRHYLESVKDDGDLDQQFKSLLRHHWMEESQHAKLDTLMIEALASTRSGEEIDRAVDGYLDIGGFLDGGLKQQVELDLESFVRATGRKLSDEERAEFIKVQHQANRWTYLGSGMTHPEVLGTLESIRPAAR